ncbi:hypothetical protein PG996_003272 [Apiospora saccharicola]|uniref:Uncharacterized protein n=1 Tax=Apiospora saccharicola TaxID=335842 RepID=A0ABR1W0T3_9PEZI
MLPNLTREPDGAIVLVAASGLEIRVDRVRVGPDGFEAVACEPISSVLFTLALWFCTSTRRAACRYAEG